MLPPKNHFSSFLSDFGSSSLPPQSSFIAFPPFLQSPPLHLLGETTQAQHLSTQIFSLSSCQSFQDSWRVEILQMHRLTRKRQVAHPAMAVLKGEEERRGTRMSCLHNSTDPPKGNKGLGAGGLPPPWRERPIRGGSTRGGRLWGMCSPGYAHTAATIWRR